MKFRRIHALIGAVSLLLVLFFFFGLFFGSVKISLGEIGAILSGRDTTSAAAKIINGIRLPRIVMALLVGMMLSAAGTITQAVFRNPLADPYIIGISSGAVSGAVLAFILKLPDIWYGVFAFFTAMGTAFLIFRLAGKRGKTDTAALLIIGVAVSAFLGALTSFFMYLAGQDSYRVMVWTMGYLGAASWSRVGLLVIPLVLSLLYFLYYRHDVDALLLGDEEAHSLGIPVGNLKRQLLVVVSLIAAFSVAFTGMIGFVGLIVPHAVRLCIGSSHSRLLPLAAYTGGIFLLFADTLARTLLSPIEIPIGVITAFFGAPFFLFLAVMNGKGRAHA
ncbi:MAG: iron chelate uptake ABC transporter family permease subunit [Treponema sp.]|nr:iron chelate uptake ABC transporter family permease subunit [Treponema sp.]